MEPPFGLFGGQEATLNRIDLQYPDGRVYTTTSKDLVEDVPAGTVLFQQAGGGGGYGDPYLRDPARVAQEVENGVISLERAKEDYGVVIDPQSLEVDTEETDKLRKKKE